MSWRPIQSRMQGWKSKAADFLTRKAIAWAPKSVREDMSRKVEADANRLNEALLDAQGFLRCAVCPERFGGGMRVVRVNGKKVQLCPTHYRSHRAGTLILG